jgi:hypothetical protein
LDEQLQGIGVLCAFTKALKALNSTCAALRLHVVAEGSQQHGHDEDGDRVGLLDR